MAKDECPGLCGIHSRVRDPYQRCPAVLCIRTRRREEAVAQSYLPSAAAGTQYEASLRAVPVRWTGSDTVTVPAGIQETRAPAPWTGVAEPGVAGLGGIDRRVRFLSAHQRALLSDTDSR